ncbi:sorting nexin-8-like [Harmonia axyridis]|uniref:sorting nexin-8-like n=1 Tax=Harmonia axyridis TaxID=115357 RepID=UPI001E276497|nr:sorting nexin-8-like [Harmonia axyridis]XP_045476814.1 sorting nexin-8-like [Harmonia axyridis]
MTSSFTEGSIPSLYRETFDVCSNNGDPIHRDVYECLLKHCNLQSSQLKLIWDIAGPPQGLISRISLYRTLALVAWAQQGKLLSEKLFENFSGKEYPTPSIPDLQSVKNLKCQIHLKSNPSILGLSYTDIIQLDTLTVELVPEKKGLFLKHSEYIVSSRRFNSKVTRRYNDFVSLNELIVNRFPYRMIPRLPPKRIVSDSQFLEVRRRALQRWITLICRHPTICHDALISFFLTDQSADFLNRIKEIFRRAPDEFMTSDIAASAKSFLPSDNTEITSREQIKTLIQAVAQLKFLAEGAIERKNSYGKDSEDLAVLMKTLNLLHIDKAYVKNWPTMQKGFDVISQELHAVANKSQQHASVEQITVSERFGLLLDVLVSHKDLCERLEKGLVNDHQAALSKMLSLKKRKIQGAIRGADTESVEKLEEKMLAQENIITNVELRSEFSLYCLHMETQLVFVYVETLSAILHSLVALSVRSHTELADIWKRVETQVQQLLPQENRKTNEST